MATRASTTSNVTPLPRPKQLHAAPAALPADVDALGLTVVFPDLLLCGADGAHDERRMRDASVADLLLYAAPASDGDDDATECVLSMVRDELRRLRKLAMESSENGRAVRSIARKIDAALELHRRQVEALRDAADGGSK
jgi:hypothetical protein